MAATKAKREPEGQIIPAGPDQAPMRQESIRELGVSLAGMRGPTHQPTVPVRHVTALGD